MLSIDTGSALKKTWGVINEIISKSAQTKYFPDIFKDGQHELNDDREVATRFNAFFINVGPKYPAIMVIKHIKHTSPRIMI